MSKYSNLMAEVEFIRRAWKSYGILEAIMFIDEMKEQYSPELQRELREFFREGAQLFAPRQN